MRKLSRLADLYNSGLSLLEIKKVECISSGTIVKRLRLEGVGIRPPCPRRKIIEESILDKLINLYDSGLTLKEIIEETGIVVSYVTLGKCFKEKGVSLRESGPRKIYSCNENFFEIIDSEEKAYWLGFLAADGCVSQPRGRINQGMINLSLKRGDRDCIVKYKKALGATHPVEDYEGISRGRRYFKSRLRLSSKKMYNDLIDKGVVPRKSLILKPPKNVPDHLIHHWIRGYFDGDGSVFRRGERKYRNVKITSTFEVLEFIKEVLGGMGANIRKNLKSKAFHYNIGAQADVKKFADYIYKDATVFMERKRERFLWS